MYFELLKEWCDALVAHQITQFKQKELYGGIMCPACARIHGRCGDAIYPLLFMADKTKDDTYLESAKRLFQWAENMVRPDGSYINDTNSDWKGITVFSSIQLGEALYYHGHLLDDTTKKRWLERFRTAVDFLYFHIDTLGGNINYPITCAASMTVAARLLGETKYAEKAKSLARKALAFITEDGLLFGEGHPNDGTSGKNCRAVDLGYNVEETLGGLVNYALLANDTYILKIAQQLMETHLSFMLPDGAWDNSWGTRNYKWTYWGGRTSDGCQESYGLLAKNNPLFAEAVFRNTQLLKECTHDGLLHGGPMYYTAQEPPCIHHTICHAKAIAVMLEQDIAPTGGEKLPREAAQGIQTFPSIHVSLVSKADWRATVSDYDFAYSQEGHASGGAVTMLWHSVAGPVLAASMTHYSLVEPNNMQLPQYTKDICLTPRFESVRDGVYYRSINDITAQVHWQNGNAITASVTGCLMDGKQNGREAYALQYTFTDDCFTIKGKTGAKEARFILPVISKSTDPVEWQDAYNVRVTTGKAVILVHCTQELQVQTGFGKKQPLTQANRIFNPVGGFEAIPFYITPQPNKEFALTIQVIK